MKVISKMGNLMDMVKACGKQEKLTMANGKIQKETDLVLMFLQQDQSMKDNG